MSITVYGMSQLGVKWMDLSAELRDAISDACIATFHSSNKSFYALKLEQAIANIIYSYAHSYTVALIHSISHLWPLALYDRLGNMDANWNEFSPSLCNALSNAIVRYGRYLSTQELSNSIYG